MTAKSEIGEFITVAELGEIIKAGQAWYAEQELDALEGPLPENAAEVMINQFLSDIGFPKAGDFSFTNNGVKVIHETIKPDKDKNRLGIKRLSVFMGFETAAASVDSNGINRLGWARRDGIAVSGAPTHHEDLLKTQKRMQGMLSAFFAKPQEQPAA